MCSQTVYTLGTFCSQSRWCDKNFQYLSVLPRRRDSWTWSGSRCFSRCWPALSPASSGGLRPPQAAVLPHDRRLPHLLLRGQPRQFPERARGVGAGAAGVRTQRAVPAHRHPGEPALPSHCTCTAILMCLLPLTPVSNSEILFHPHCLVRPEKYLELDTCYFRRINGNDAKNETVADFFYP